MWSLQECCMPERHCQARRQAQNHLLHQLKYVFLWKKQLQFLGNYCCQCVLTRTGVLQATKVGLHFANLLDRATTSGIPDLTWNLCIQCSNAEFMRRVSKRVPSYFLTHTTLSGRCFIFPRYYISAIWAGTRSLVSQSHSCYQSCSPSDFNSVGLLIITGIWVGAGFALEQTQLWREEKKVWVSKQEVFVTLQDAIYLFERDAGI